MKYSKPQSGDTLIEVVIALAILAVTLTSAFNVATLSYRVGASSRDRTEAINLAQQQADMLRQYRDAAEADTTGAHGAYPIAVAPFLCPPPFNAPGRMCWHMDANGAGNIIRPASGELVSGRYGVDIFRESGNPTAPPPLPPGTTLALDNYYIFVHWAPAIGDSTGGETQVSLLLTLADRRNFALKPCEDATVPACSNLAP